MDDDDYRDLDYRVPLADLTDEQLKEIEDVLNDPDEVTAFQIEKLRFVYFGGEYDFEESRAAYVNFRLEWYLYYETLTLEWDDDILCVVGRSGDRKTFEIPVTELFSSTARFRTIKAKD